MPNQLPAASKPSGFNQLLIVVTYKWFATAVVVILMVLGIKQISYLLIMLLAVYNSIFSLIIRKRPFNPRYKLLLLGIDFVVCICLLFISGGWASPYFQYGLSFLILSALLFGFRGVALSIVVYGTFYYIGLYLNGLSLSKIIAKGYLESFITDYAIFAAVGLSSAFIAKILSNLGLQAHVSKDYMLEEKPAIESLPTSLSFTPQQALVARLMVDGLDNDQIASELGISVNTVKFHLKNIYRKLDVNCRSKAIQRLVDDEQFSNLSMPTPKDKTPS